MITYTSGTTGKPMGAELTHHQLYVNCTANGQLFRFRDEDISMSVVPTFPRLRPCPACSTWRCGSAEPWFWCPDSTPEPWSTNSPGAAADVLRRFRQCIARCCRQDADGRDLSALRVGYPRRRRLSPAR